MDETERKSLAIKSASTRYAEYYGDVRRRLTEEYSRDVRWTVASIFALNSGGLLAISQSASLSIGDVVAAGLFWLGISLAFARVSYSQKKTRKFVGAITKLEEVHVLASTTGRIDGLRAKKYESEKNNVKTGAAGYLLYFSYGCFSLALLSLLLIE